MAGGFQQSLAAEEMGFIEPHEDVSTWLKLTWDEDVPYPVLFVLLQAAPDAHGGRLLASVSCILG
jgi:hypothetical protein